MKIITIILGILLCASVGCASPFLVCDPSTIPITQVEVEINGVVYVGTYIGTTEIKLYDLAGFANGNYIFRARWADASGWWSDWSDPLNAVKSGKPGNFRIK